MNATTPGVVEMMETARYAAAEAGSAYFRDVMCGVDRDCCGFAWVEVEGARGKVAESLKAYGFYKSTSITGRTVLCYNFWHSEPTQGLTCLEKANEAGAAVLREAGFNVNTRSMMD